MTEWIDELTGGAISKTIADQVADDRAAVEAALETATETATEAATEAATAAVATATAEAINAKDSALDASVLATQKAGEANDAVSSVADMAGTTARRDDITGHAFAIADEYGNIAVALSEDGATLLVPELLNGAGNAVSEMERRADVTSVSVAIVDDDGNTAFELTGDGLSIPGTSINHSGRADFSLAIADEDGFIGFLVEPGTGVRQGSSVVAFSAADIADRNTKALAKAAAVTRQYQADTQRPVFAYNHIIAYGQSLSNGWEGWPALSTTARYAGALMLGQSVHPQTEYGTTWLPIGDTTLRPLIATVRDDSGNLLNAAAQAALSPGDGKRGETVLEGALHYLRRAWNDARGTAEDSARKFVATACGSGGMTIEQLSKGASPEYFNRVRTAATAVKAAATAAGGDYGIPAVLWLQGEWNYTTEYGGTTDKATYKAKLKQLVADLRADVQTTIAGQVRPFALFTYQTGGSFTADATGLSVGMAQWELSEEEPNWHLVAPNYPVTDKGGHLDPNGYRWLGTQFGKVMHRVLVLGEKWKPLSPLAATIRGREILVDFHVPVPPLVFDRPYDQTSAVDYPSKGFVAVDGIGTMTPAVEIVADAVVRLVLPRDPTGAVTVRYAGKATFNGSGCLRDSDPAVADDLYVYTAGTGQYAGANIPALVGNPYPLHNWCVAFNIPAVAG